MSLAIAKLKSILNNSFITMILISSAVFIIVFREMLFVGLFDANDIGPPLHSFLQLKFASIFPWSFMGSGTPNAPSLWILFLGFLASLTSNLVIVQHVSYYTLFPLSGILAYIFLKKIGISMNKRITLSVLYMFSPYAIILFANGSGIYQIFAFFPAYAIFIWKAGEQKLSRSDFLIVTAILTINAMYTIESFFLFIYLSIPFLIRMAYSIKIRIATYNFFVLILSAISSLLMNLVAIFGLNTFYVTTYNYLGNAYRNFLLTPYIEPWLSILVVMVLTILAIAIIKVIFADRKELMFILASLIESFLFLLLFIGTRSSVIDRFLSTFLFSFFTDYEYFILILWTLMFITFSIFIRDLNVQHKCNNLSIRSKVNNRLINKKVVKVTISCIVTLLIVFTTFYGDISDYNIQGNAILSVDSLVANSQIPPQYQDYASFLRDNGISYNYSFHSTVMPLTPGYANPLIFGKTLLPGFICTFSYNLSSQFIMQVNQNNQTNALIILTLLGIKYVAIMPNLKGEQLWSYNTTGLPMIQGWNGKYFFGGNWKYYLKIFSNWTMFKEVFKEKNLWVFENSLLVTPVLAFKNESVIKNICSGNFLSYYNISKESINLSEIGRSNYSNNWNLYYWNSTGQFVGFNGNNTYIQSQNVNAGLDIKLFYGSEGALIHQSLQLKPNTSYELSFDLSQNTSYDYYPPSPFHLTYADVQWFTSMGNPNLSTGYFSLTPEPGNYSKHCVLIFRTPLYHKSIINASLQMCAEPPIKAGQTTSVKYSNIDLFAVNISTKNLNHVMMQLPYKSVGDKIYLYGLQSSYDYVVLDTQQYHLWKGITKTGSIIPSTSSLNGQLAFNITVANLSSFQIVYVASPLYFSTLYISILSSLVFFLIIIPFYYIKRVNGYVHKLL